jgi:hypothetical protein
MESVVKGDRPMGMKGYAGDLDRLFGIGGHGTGAKGETVPPAPAHHSSFQKGAIPKKGVRFRRPRKANPPPASDSPPQESCRTSPKQAIAADHDDF